MNSIKEGMKDNPLYDSLSFMDFLNIESLIKNHIANKHFYFEIMVIIYHLNDEIEYNYEFKMETD